MTLDTLRPYLLAIGLFGGPYLAYVLIRTSRRARLFSQAQKREVGYAFKANCVWRPSQTVLILPGIVCTQLAWETHDGRWMSAAQGLLIWAIWGFPVVRVAPTCGGVVQGGHQWSHSTLGGTNIWNCEPACEAHNGPQSATWSFWFAWKQWGPISLAVYTYRNWAGTVRLAIRKFRGLL